MTVHTRPLALRDEALHRAENWLTAFGALIPADQIENLAISLAADLAKPAIDEVQRQAERITAVRLICERLQRELLEATPANLGIRAVRADVATTILNVLAATE